MLWFLCLFLAVDTYAWPDASFAQSTTIQSTIAVDGETISVTVAGPVPFLGVTFPSDGMQPINNCISPEGIAWLMGQPVADRVKHFWPSGRVPFRCAAWRTATDSRCLSIAGCSLEPVYFVAGNPLLVIIKSDIPAGQSRTYRFRLRVRPLSASLEDLLQSYGSDLRKSFGTQAYHNNPSPVVQWIRYNSTPSPQNPYGWINWRPDTEPVAAKAWAVDVANKAKEKGFQGAIAWGFAWASPESSYWGYPINSYDLTTPAREIYDGFFAGTFGDVGLRWGCLHRVATEQLSNAASPVWQAVDSSPASVKRLTLRLTQSGTLHYFDTSPDIYGVENNGATVLETAIALREARKLCGDVPQWFTESTVDINLANAGIYTEIYDTVPPNVQVARALYPRCGVLAKSRSAMSVSEFRQWCDARKFSALVEDWQIGGAGGGVMFSIVNPESDTLAEVNAARAKKGLKPFIYDAGLEVAAKKCAELRAASLIAGHLPNDFAHVPQGTTAKAAGCGALEPSWGWGTCCMYDNYTYAGAAVVMGRDGRRYMHLFVR